MRNKYYLLDIYLMGIEDNDWSKLFVSAMHIDDSFLEKFFTCTINLMIDGGIPPDYVISKFLVMIK